MERSRRKLSKPIRFSPTPTSKSQAHQQPRRRPRQINDEPPSGDLLSDGSLFLCGKCGSTFLDSKARGVRIKSKVVHPALRYSSSGEELMYCRTCGMEHDRRLSSSRKIARQVSDTENGETVEYLKEIEAFTRNLAEKMANTEVLKLVCYNPSKRCQCLSQYLMSLSTNHLTAEVQSLLETWNKASQLKTLKTSDQPIGTKNRKVGLGNGKKRTKDYENYVLNERVKLREERSLCEHTTQKILSYSNNFLHKSLLTEQRRTRVGDKSRVNLLPVTVLWKHQCCRDNCTRVTRTHLNLVVKWRQLAVGSRRGLQQAVAELLTPTAGAKTNCYKFITMVTGCSTATIAKVAKKIRKNGGVLGMHEHGLRRYWRSKRELEAGGEVSSDEEEVPSVWTLPQHHAEEVELRQTVDKQSRQLELLKSQLAEQKTKIDEQQAQLVSATVRSFPSGVMKSPTQQGWRPASQHNTPTNQGSSWGGATRLSVDTGSFSSPQYPYKQTTPNHSLGSRNHSAKSLLQPSKLDSTLKREDPKLQSHSYVVATSKPQPTAPQFDRQHSLHAMQYLYNPTQDQTTTYSQNHSIPDALASNFYLNQHLQTPERLTNFGSVNSSYSHAMLTNDFFTHDTDGKSAAIAPEVNMRVLGIPSAIGAQFSGQQTVHSAQNWCYPTDNFAQNITRSDDGIYRPISMPPGFHNRLH